MTDVFRDHLQSTLGQSYTIERELSGGGMSRVFVAHEVTLGRPVVVKMLAPDFAASVSAERFRREIRLAAGLQQANIVPVLSAGECEGLPYYTMPFVEGESLRARLSASGQAFPVREVIGILRDIARALAFAHGRGVVHRDIKPENVLLSGTTAVVTDFGIAKALESALVTPTAPTLTQIGSAIGTPMYMAPEQVSADPNIDHRADIYSFGVLAYELLTGAAPFSGRTTQALFAAHLTERPEPIQRKRPEVPGGLATLVLRCMEKDPDARPQTAAEIVDALDAVTTPVPNPGVASASAEDHRRVPEPAATTPSIVVLPFENLSPDPDNAFFADGLTDELIAELSHVRSLRVISRTSARAFKGTEKTIPAIASELKVRYVVEGSVRRAGNAVRIGARLIDAITDTQLWTDRYSGELDDIFDLQERLALSIVASLRVTLTPEESARLSVGGIDDPRAYEVFLRARQAAYLLTPSGLGQAIALTKEALATFGDVPLLNASLSCFYSLSYDFGISHDEDTLRTAEDLAHKALAANPDLPLALNAAGWARYKRGDLEAMLRYCKRSAEVDRNSDALWMTGFLLAEVGLTDAARPYADEAAARDPLTFIAHLAESATALFEGRFDDAVRLFNHAARLSPDEPFAQWWLGQAYVFGGREQEGLALLDAAAAAKGSIASALSAILASALRGDRAAVILAASSEPIASVALTDEYYPTNVAAALAHVGEIDHALEWVQRAIRWGFTNHEWLGTHNRLLANLRGEPRFAALLEEAANRQRALAKV